MRLLLLALLLACAATAWALPAANEVQALTVEQARAAIAPFYLAVNAGNDPAVPHLEWEIKEIMVAGDRVIVRGEATSIPIARFLEFEPAGASFRIMSIDIHPIRNGKIARSYHVEGLASGRAAPRPQLAKDPNRSTSTAARGMRPPSTAAGDYFFGLGSTNTAIACV